FNVQRSVAIKAPAEKIFALIQDLHAWSGWSPYEKKDPAMKRTFGGAPAGKGAFYEWAGNRNVGAGRMEIVEAAAPSTIVIGLDFREPFEGHNTARFTLEPRGDNTTVTWAMYGPSAYIARVIGIFLDMDKMIGSDFDAGLANLKSLAEK
ncbi:MAG: SRPBCC family protein, partial [Proteobacteria bacterium]|nr:SRPBCC family protein [Pseudomonadota bacterium]